MYHLLFLMYHGCRNLLLDTKNLRLDTPARPKSRNFAADLQPESMMIQTTTLLAAIAAAPFTDALLWLVPLVVVVASAVGFGAAAYFWGRNSRIERYLRSHNNDKTATE